MPPTVTAGKIVTAEMLRWEVVAPLEGVNGSMFGIDGVVNPSTTQCFIMFGSYVDETDLDGEMTVTFSTPFANGIQTLVPANGDAASGGWTPAVVDANAGGFVVAAMQDLTTPLPSAIIRVNLMAIGW